MADYREEAGFYASDEIPTFRAGASVSTIFRTLAQTGQVGFILDQGGRPSRYIDARALIPILLRMFGTSPRARKHMGRTVLQSVIDRLPEDAYLPIDFMPVPGHELNKIRNKFPDQGFIVTEQGKHAGWYLNRPWVPEARTRRVVFVCIHKHVNWDPDTNWTCYTCFYPVAPVEQEDMRR